MTRNPLQIGLRPAGASISPGGFPQRRASDVTAVTKDQMREIERIALEDFHLEIAQITENVGRATASLAHAMLGRHAKGQRIVILVGPGNKGGGGLCAARLLSNMGFAVETVLGAVEDEMPIASRRQLFVLRESGVAEPRDFQGGEYVVEERLLRADLIIDALVGYGLVTGPSGIASACVDLAVDSKRPVLAIDVPTGVNATTGEAAPSHIHATTTLALDLPKRGTVDRSAREHVGELYLADIGIPRAVHLRVGIPQSDTFSEGPIVRLRR